MPEGTVYVLHGTVYRFTGKGLRYFEIIRKNHPITHWVKEQMETGNWTILESTYNIHDVHSPLTFPEG